MCIKKTPNSKQGKENILDVCLASGFYIMSIENNQKQNN